jgi:hypothetical protein
MGEINFKPIVLANAQELFALGYKLMDPDPALDLVGFRKDLVPNLICQVSYQLNHHYVSPVRSFSINLGRWWSPPKARPSDQAKFEPGGDKLFYLLQGLYGINCLPAGKYRWEFTDNDELVSQLRKANLYLIKYGLSWLEDPQSTVDWRHSDLDQSK